MILYIISHLIVIIYLLFTIGNYEAPAIHKNSFNSDLTAAKKANDRTHKFSLIGRCLIILVAFLISYNSHGNIFLWIASIVGYTYFFHLCFLFHFRHELNFKIYQKGWASDGSDTDTSIIGSKLPITNNFIFRTVVFLISHTIFVINLIRLLYVHGTP